MVETKVAARRVAYLFFLAIFCLGHHPMEEGILFYAGSLPPYIIIHDEEPPSGFAVDLLREVMREAELPFSDAFLATTNWARAVRDVEMSPEHALLVLALLPDRINKYKWVGPIAEMSMGVFSRKEDEIRLTDERELLKYRIGMVRDTAMINVLKAVHPGIEKNIVQVSSIETQLRMLREGRVDLIVQAILGTRKTMNVLGMDMDDYPLGLELDSLELHFGFNVNTNDEYIAVLQGALDRLKIRGKRGEKSRYEQIKAKYFSLAKE